MNIIINDVDRPLVIKVASISSAKIQVYFIDNDDYFKRKQTFCDENGNFFEDNDERAIFFARGVLETVKKLRWAPDIIHCQGWISHILPLYLKKSYKEDPIFSNSKIALSLFNDCDGQRFSNKFAEKLAFGNIKPEDAPFLADATGINLAKTAIQYSDAIILGAESIDKEILDFCKERDLPILPYNEASFKDGRYIDEYNSFYDQL